MKIVSFQDNELTQIGNGFLYCNKALISFQANSLKQVGGWFLFYHSKREQFLDKVSNNLLDKKQ